jgi:4-carboxymuconolactone decarboxylase
MPSPRIRPQGPDEWNDDAREMFAFCEGPEAREKGSVSPIIRTFAHHPKLMLAWLKFNGRLLAAPKIPPRLRELVILRLADRFQCKAEWLQHVDISIEMGLGQEHFDAVKVGPEDPLWTDLERNALRAADEMVTDYKIGDTTWNALATEFDTKQMIEFMFIVGVYSMLGWFLNSIEAEPVPGSGEGKTNYLETTLKAGPRSG